MISDLNVILYACVSKGTMVLAEFNSGDGDLETLALQCLEKYPQLHARFSHTIRNRIYCFLIEDPLVYFAILDEELGKMESFQFLERLKEEFVKIVNTKSVDDLEYDLTSYCFQEEFRPVFHRLLARSCNVRASKSFEEMLNDHQNSLLDLMSSGNKDVSMPLVEQPGKQLKKKKKKKRASFEEMNDGTRDMPLENKVDVSDDVNLSQEFSLSLQKNGPFKGVDTHIDAKKMWRRHVWTVLALDLIVCCVLFGVWLWICKGFECISS